MVHCSRRVRVIVCQFFGGVAMLAVANVARADLLAYEGFDYNVGATLNGLDGGIGFSGPWGDVLMQGIGDGASDVIVADSLTYMDSGGNVLQTSGHKLLNSGAGGTSFIGRALSFRRDDATADSTWLSLLGVRLGMPVRGANFTIFDTTHAPPGGPPQDGEAEKLNIGENSGITFTLPDGVTTEDRWVLRAPQVTPNAWLPEHEPPTANFSPSLRDAYTEVLFTDQAFVVVRIDHVDGAEDVVHFWMNPDLGETPSTDDAAGYFRPDELYAAADAIFATAYNNNPPNNSEFSFDLIRLFAGNDQGSGPGEWHLDEIRIGDTFQDVAPIDGGGGGQTGDYNEDGVVNAADYVVFRNNEGTMSVLPNDPIGGQIGQGHYEQWVSNFGQGTPNGGGGSSSAVPEPATGLLLLLAVAIAGVYRRG